MRVQTQILYSNTLHHCFKDKGDLGETTRLVEKIIQKLEQRVKDWQKRFQRKSALLYDNRASINLEVLATR